MMPRVRADAHRRLLLPAAIFVAAFVPPATAAAQQPVPPASHPGRDTARTPHPSPAAAPQVAVSGILFGNYQYQTGGPARDANQFLLERAYLTARATLGQGVSARVTTDVFQSGDQNGWTIRLKYGYLQHDAKAAGWAASTRAGMLHTVVVEHVESFWPRWLGNAATERHGYFSSADVGVAELVTLPAKLGEVYATVTNGVGYTRRETDRFKDAAVRLSLTPLAARTSGLLATLTLTGWVYEGASASRFVTGGTGQVGPVGSGLQKDRWGLFAGVRDPRLVLGAEYAARTEEVEAGANTALSPRAVAEVEGHLRSVFAVVRPLAFANASGRSRLGLVGRWDDFRPGTTGALANVGERVHYAIAGALFDVTPRLSVALDYQEQLARRDLVAEAKTWFAHFNLTF